MLATFTMSDIQTYLEILDPSKFNDAHRSLLREFLGNQELESHIHNLDRSGLERFVELLDEVGSKVDVDLHQH